jgi:hypothetical protein
MYMVHYKHLINQSYLKYYIYKNDVNKLIKYMNKNY